MAKYLEGHEVIPVCPEVLGGLPTPRDPSEIVSGEVINCKGVNVDRQFREGAEEALRIAKENGIDLAILQSRSPSCGVKQIYDGNFTGKLIPGQGNLKRFSKDGTDYFIFQRGSESFPSIGSAILLPTDLQLRSIVESGNNRRVIIGQSPLANNANVAVDPDRLFGPFRSAVFFFAFSATLFCYAGGLCRS